MNTEFGELRASPPRLQGRRCLPVVAEAPCLRRLQLIILILTPIMGGKVLALLQVFVVHLRILQNQEYGTNCYYTSQRAPEVVPARPAALEMVPRPATVREAPSPDGRVLSDLASSCLAYEAVVALRSSACGLAHRSVGYAYESSRQISVRCYILLLRSIFLLNQSSNTFFSCQHVPKCHEYQILIVIPNCYLPDRVACMHEWNGNKL